MGQNVKLNKRKFISATDSEYIYEKFLNLLMYDGKKAIARRLLNRSLKRASQKLEIKDSNFILKRAIENIAPTVSIKSKRIGSTVYQIPGTLSKEKSINQGIKLFIFASRSRKEVLTDLRISNELIDAFNNKGITSKKRDEIHKIAESNKSFAHFNK
jgi:small subunit ribosomal protein S7